MDHVPYADPIDGVPLLQHPLAPWAFFEAFQRFHPKVIVEIGTGVGGLTLHLSRIKPPGCRLISYDREDLRYNVVRQADVDFRKRDVFNGQSIVEISTLLCDQGTCLLLCDGGSKVQEFNLFAPALKHGDVIMAHDYARDHATFMQEMQGKRWDWLEITDEQIAGAIRTCNLSPWNEELFSPVAWGAFRRL